LWRRTSTGSNILDNSSTTWFIDSKVKSSSFNTNITQFGCLQFYPNPNSLEIYENTNIKSNNLSLYGFGSNIYNFASQVTLNNSVSAGYILSSGQFYGNHTNSYQFSSTTNGGVCVRALNGSLVNIDNVHFPCGWWDSSAVIYEANGPEGLCCRTFIWNIADESKLNAQLVSVSGLYPFDARYNGPPGTWGNASGAPATTPDTGSVSILDYYGSAATVHRYAETSYKNKGPFRLYFSIDPAINNADGVDTTGIKGYLPQVYSQGYQFSGNLNFSGFEGSYYKSLLNPSSTNSAVASGFYYASSILSEPRTINAVLDESASNLFANSKHNTVGKSGLGKKVCIYLPYTAYSGGEFADNSKQRGVGFKSSNVFDLDKDN
ncbi:MAG: hypothetical protein RL348_1791, partial [Bacteroidota bacterium]